MQLCHRRSSAGRGPGVAGARAGAGTRGAQAAARFSVLVVFLLLELGHQAEFTAAAALGKIQHHVLWGRGEMERVRPPFTQVAPPSRRWAWGLEKACPRPLP